MMSAFDVIILFCLIINTILLIFSITRTNDIMEFIRSSSFIWIIVAYISIITAYIVITQIVERMYE